MVKAAKRRGVAKPTASRWRHRFLAASALDKPARLNGIVEADETFILESFKGRRSDLPRPARKRSQILPSSGGPRPEAPNLHIDNMNGYHSRLKEWLRRFHGVATKYLDTYLGWRRIAEARGGGIQPADWLRSAVGVGCYR